MVTIDKKLQEVLALYDVNLKTSKNSNGKDVFVDITDGRNGLLKATVQYSNNRIYCVYFLNNQYFEEDVDVLYEVFNAILMGDYRVRHRGIFRKRRYVEVNLKTNRICPERIISDDEFKLVYDILPAAYSKKR